MCENILRNSMHVIIIKIKPDGYFLFAHEYSFIKWFFNLPCFCMTGERTSQTRSHLWRCGSGQAEDGDGG